MPYRVAFDEADGIVYVTYSGKVAKKDHLAAWAAAAQSCAEHACSRLLVDFHDLSVNTLSTMDCYSFGKMVAQSAQFLNIAHVFPKDPKACENVRFASTVEANRGKKTREFATVEEARKWLLGLK